MRRKEDDDELWDARLASLDEFLGEPGFRETLAIVQPHLSTAFVDLVGTRIGHPQ